MHVEGLVRGVAEGLGAEAVAIALVTRALFLAVVLVRSGPVERLDAPLGHELWHPDDVGLEVAEHLVRETPYHVALSALRPDVEEQDRAALFVGRHRFAVTPREPVDGRVGTYQRELELGECGRDVLVFDRTSTGDVVEDPPEQVAVLLDRVHPARDLGAHRDVVSDKAARHLEAVRHGREGLGGEQVIEGRQPSAVGRREAVPLGVVERIERIRREP